MKTLTVFTPAFNRAYCLHQLYESLQRQTSKDFEWLIVDDGSTDNTESLVNSWIRDNLVPIRYYRQQNQGMHGAHNTAYEHIETELNVCIDSDDYMTDNAVELIVSFWKKHRSDKVCGFIGLDAYTNGQIIGTELPKHMKSSTLYDLYYKHGVKGDKKLIYRTELVKDNPYPLFESENYVGLNWKYLLLDQKYELLIMHEILCIVEYLPDGSTKNMLKQYRRNPKGFAFYRKELMKLPFGSLAFRYRQAVHYVSSSIISRNKNWLNEVPFKWLTILAIPLGLMLYGYISIKTKGVIPQKGTTNDYPMA
ncbi:glycosyltransferase family 2 protein [Paenibacillus harenae]|uniref:glycosyltransferase family 2 protein n=1 Tax=Paenibacillus harenae TaxID=306543 RepID=UPI00042839A1|nr:glycosyltransferase family 2 protein [Paenibacillus harenae]